PGTTPARSESPFSSAGESASIFGRAGSGGEGAVQRGSAEDNQMAPERTTKMPGPGKVEASGAPVDSTQGEPPRRPDHAKEEPRRDEGQDAARAGGHRHVPPSRGAVLSGVW